MYAIALAPGARFPFEPADELQPVDTATGTGERGRSASGATATPAVTVVHDGIQQRLVEVPLPAGNCDNLTANDQRLFWIERETALPRRANLMTLHITSDAPKPKALADDVRGYELSGDGKKLGVRKGMRSTSSRHPPRHPPIWTTPGWISRAGPSRCCEGRPASRYASPCGRPRASASAT
jgi:tricorn protease